MRRTVVTSLPFFAREAEEIARCIGGDFIAYRGGTFKDLFKEYDGIVAMMSAGIIIRSVAPLLTGKWDDPAIVMVTPDGRFAVPLIGGHHGANQLALSLWEHGITPVISTATEALGRDSVEGIMERSGTTVINRVSTRSVNAACLQEDVPVYRVAAPSIVIAEQGVSLLAREGVYTVGIGCRRGTSRSEIVDAVRAALEDAKVEVSDVFLYATTVRKIHEHGLRQGVGDLGGVLFFVDDATIAAHTGPSPSRAGKIGLLGVAEPCALALARKGELVMEKRVFGKVTVAVAR